MENNCTQDKLILSSTFKLTVFLLLVNDYAFSHLFHLYFYITKIYSEILQSPKEFCNGIKVSVKSKAFHNDIAYI